MNPSGTGRSIADSWFSDEPMPRGLHAPDGGRSARIGGVEAKEPDRAAIEAYLAAVDVQGAIDGMARRPRARRPARAYLRGPRPLLSAMWDLSMEILGKRRGGAVRAMRDGGDGQAARAFGPAGEAAAGGASCLRGRAIRQDAARSCFPPSTPGGRERIVPPKSIPTLANAFIARFDAGTTKHLAPHLPEDLRRVPRANMTFLPIKDAWFSGSMNYIGRARNADGSPQYEATYEINASLQISVPEFKQLVGHEVVPGHVTNGALMQGLYVRRGDPPRAAVRCRMQMIDPIHRRQL